MKRYIKLNEQKQITDIFPEVWKDRFDGTEIFFDEVSEISDCYINGKCISDEIGNPIFKYDKGKITELPVNESLLAYQIAKENNEIMRQIEEKEKKQDRAIREHLIGDVTAKKRLQDIDAEIAVLRGKLK